MLNGSQRAHLAHLQKEYDRDMDEFNQVSKALAEILKLIGETVTISGVKRAITHTSVHEILIDLKLTAASSARTLELELIQRYLQVRKGPSRNQELREWLLEWENVY